MLIVAINLTLPSFFYRIPSFGPYQTANFSAVINATLCCLLKKNRHLTIWRTILCPLSLMVFILWQNIYSLCVPKCLYDGVYNMREYYSLCVTECPYDGVYHMREYYSLCVTECLYLRNFVLSTECYMLHVTVTLLGGGGFRAMTFSTLLLTKGDEWWSFREHGKLNFISNRLNKISYQLGSISEYYLSTAVNIISSSPHISSSLNIS